MGCESSRPCDASKLRFQLVEEIGRDGADARNERFWGLAANDGTKELLRKFLTLHKAVLPEIRFCGTQTTGKMLKRDFDVELVSNFQSGPMGGDQQLVKQIIDGKVVGGVFFHDPLAAHAHATDIIGLQRMFDAYQLYSCCTYRTASAVFAVRWTQLDFEDLHHNFDPDIQLMPHYHYASEGSGPPWRPSTESASTVRTSTKQSLRARLHRSSSNLSELLASPSPPTATRMNLKIGIMQHEEMTPFVMDLVRRHRGIFAGARIVGTRALGKQLTAKFGIRLAEEVAPVSLGGAQMMGAMMVEELPQGGGSDPFDCIIILENPLSPAAYSIADDFQALRRLCTVHQILFGTNYRTCDAIMEFLGLRRNFHFEGKAPEDLVSEKYLAGRKNSLPDIDPRKEGELEGKPDVTAI